MSYSDDPDYWQIRQEFLSYVRCFHRSKGYSFNWRQLCRELNISVTEGRSNHHTVLQGKSIISFDTGVAANRQTFTGLHELSHHLFATSEEGFRALLEEKYPADICKSLEESLCNEAAGILLIPDSVLEQAMTTNGYTPQVVFDLSERVGSLAACLTRVVLAHDIEAWGLIMRRDGILEYSCTNTRYTLSRDHCIEKNHAVHQAWHGALCSSAPLPYASGNRKVRKLMRAASDNRRVVAFFAKDYPVFSGNRQEELFK